MLDMVYVYPLTYKGRAFLKPVPSGPVNENIMILKAQKEGITYDRLNYPGPTA